MPVVGMPDGTQVDFGDMPAEQIKSMIAQKFPDAPKQAAAPMGRLDHMAATVTDIPHKIYEAGSAALSGLNEAFNPYSETQKAEMARKMERAKTSPFTPSMDDFNSLKNTGSGLLSVPALALSPLTGTVRSVVGHTADALDPLTQEQTEKARKMGAHLPGGDDVADLVMSALATGRGGVRSQAPAPPQPIQTGPLGVILSEGQTTRALPAIQAEQAALRGTSGPTAQGRAQQFAEQQRQQVAAARDAVSTGMDQFGQKIVAGPQEAAELAQRSIQTTAAQRKAGVTQAYDEAKALPGEIHAGAFEGIGQRIKSDLSAGDNPVVIDDKLTPFASRAIQDVEDRISQLKIQNRADPFGQPSQEDIVGINLKGVDQMRRRLSAFRKDAYGSGNAADGRAASAVVEAFDAQVDAAINGGLFKGDPRAVQAWNDARAAHADYKSTFSAGKNDPVGRVVERILGKGNNPAAIPNDVADFIYGSTGVNPNTVNVAAAKRVRSILGDQSPEWAGVKQGLFSKLVETPEGVTDFGPGKIAQRLNQFLNGSGKELAEAVYAPHERALIKQYADLHRALEVPQAGANWSNTATFLAPLLKSASNRLGSMIGGLLSHIPILGPVAGALVDNVGGALSNARNLQQVTKQMPLITEAAQKFQRAIAAYNRANTPPSRIGLSIAASNLSRAFSKIGISLAVQGPSVSAASDEQQVPRPPGQ